LHFPLLLPVRVRVRGPAAVHRREIVVQRRKHLALRLHVSLNAVHLAC